MAKWWAFVSGETELPPDVLDRLAGRESVTLHVGLIGAVTPCSAIAVPLRDTLYVLFRPTPAASLVMEDSVATSLSAAADDGSWSILVRGRLLPGRSALLDERRNELAHWVPEGEASTWMAARFFPEFLDYQVEGESGRRRATGPLPGFAPRVRWRIYSELAFEPYQAWFLVSGVLLALGILGIADHEQRTPPVLVLGLFAGQSAFVAARVLLAPVDLVRWREGLEADRSLGVLGQAWLAPGELRADGLKLAAASALSWGLLLLFAGSVVVGLVSLLSGAPVALLAMAVKRRARGRREDRE
ncbi:MAG: hypothetical protein EXR71_16455 [Myxococcales bacterium]|nr:hypothetical protein [Myxococcales bacterium]